MTKILDLKADIPATQPAPVLELGGVGGNALRGLLQLLLKRLYLAGGVLLFALALSLLYLFISQPLYRSSALLEIFRDSADSSTNVAEDSRTVQAIDSEFYETQFGLLRSEATAMAVVRKLKLVSNPKFLAPTEEGRPSSANALYEREVMAVQKLQKNLQIVPSRQSRLVEVRYTDGDPRLARDIANQVADTFIEMNFDRRVQRSEFARQFLNRQIEIMRGKFEQQERALVDYAAKNEILSIPASRSADQGDGASQTAGQSVAGAELAALMEQLAEARAIKAAAQGRLGMLNGRNGSVPPEALNNPAINALEQQRATIEASIANLSETFDDEYPPLAAKRSELRAVNRQLAVLRTQISDGVTSEYAAAAQREALLQARVDGLKDQLIGVTQSSVGYNILQRDVDTTRQQYENLLQRLKQVSIENDIGTSNVAFVQRARVPLKPFAPDFLQVMTIGLLVGLVLMVGAVVVAELLDTTVRDPESVRQRFGEPLMGIIPSVDEGDVQADLNNMRSTISEAYVSALANLRFATPQGAPHILSITSTKPSEGKSTTALALALLFTRQGERTILVDADMRKPTVHNRLKVSNDFGLSNLLTGDDNTWECIGQSDEAPGVFILTSGPMPPNPAELLSDQRLQIVLEKLKGEFNRIVIDCPPVLGLADAPLLANASDGTLFVIESGKSRFGATRRAVDRLLAMRANVVGVILTKFKPRSTKLDEYGYSSYHYYNYSVENK